MFNKKSFYSKHEGDILSYEHADKKLSELNINIDTPLDKVVSVTKEYTAKNEALGKEFKAIEERLKDVKAAKEKVNEVLNKDRDIERKKSRDHEL
jgi:septation ring formation regulator EzrA